jgi:DNA-binding NarL/FixJ family response regulator
MPGSQDVQEPEKLQASSATSSTLERPGSSVATQASACLDDLRRTRPMPKVLIVDDHAFIRRGIQSILNASPEWELVGEAENGIAAIRMSRDLNPDIIVMDVSMPELNGIEAARAIHQLQPQIKIVLLTLHESAELVRSAFRAGAQGYLLKSEAEQELLRALRIVTGEGTYISPKVDPQVAKTVVHEISSNPG